MILNVILTQKSHQEMCKSNSVPLGRAARQLLLWPPLSATVEVPAVSRMDLAAPSKHISPLPCCHVPGAGTLAKRVLLRHCLPFFVDPVLQKMQDDSTSVAVPSLLLAARLSTFYT